MDLQETRWGTRPPPQEYLDRQNAVIAHVLLHSQADADALLFLTNGRAIYSHDIHYPFRPSSDVIYLCGARDPDVALFMPCTDSTPVLFYLDRLDARSSVATFEDRRTDVPPEHLDYSVCEVRYGLQALRTTLDAWHAEGVRVRVVYDAGTHAWASPHAARVADDDPAWHMGEDSPGVLERLGWRIAATATDGPLLRSDPLATAAVRRARLVKSGFERKCIRNAALIARASLDFLERVLRDSEWKLSERAMDNLLRNSFQSSGALGLGFNTIVALGNEALVMHHRPGATTGAEVLEAAPALGLPQLVLDVGPTVGGYACDLSRSLWFGREPSEGWRAVRDFVLGALDAMVEECQQGRRIRDVVAAFDGRARAFVRALLSREDAEGLAAGPNSEGVPETLDELLSAVTPHGTVHWIGLDAHDPQPGDGVFGDEVLEGGMALAVEPAFYCPQVGGVARCLGPWVAGCAVRIEATLFVESLGAPMVLWPFEVPAQVGRTAAAAGDSMRGA